MSLLSTAGFSMAHARRLLARHDATPLVHLQVRLRQSTRRVMSRSVHDLRPGSDSFNVHLLYVGIFYCPCRAHDIGWVHGEVFWIDMNRRVCELEEPTYV